MVGTLFVMEALKEGIIGLLLILDTLIYWLIAGAFKIFMAIAGARLLSSDAYAAIANKIYVIVGVVMLFVLSYAILRGIIDPDKETKGEYSSKMLGRVVKAVIGLALAPFIFNFMYQLQGIILEQDIIGKLFFRIESHDTYDLSGNVQVGDQNISYGSSNTNPDEYVKSIGGNITAVNLWQAFFFPAEDTGLTAAEIEADAGEYLASALGNAALCAGGIAAGAAAMSIPVVGWLVGPALMIGTAVTACAGAINDGVGAYEISQQTDGKVTLEEAYSIAAGTGEFSIFTAFIKNYADEGEITYLFIISTIAGGFALYAFVSFSIDMGVRAAMLAYLQIIAPIPIILQVLPKFKDNLNKYITKVIGTFMEVFVRISVVYVVVYIICHLTEMFGSVSTWQQNNGLSTVQQVLALALLILGLIAFCRKAPEIISETLNLPKGNMSLGIGKKLADGGFYSARSIAGSGVKGAVNSFKRVKPRQGETKVTAGQRASAALSGFGIGAASAIKSNFIGPDRKEAKTAKEARAVIDKAAQKAATSLENRQDRNIIKDQHEEQAKKFQQMMKDAQTEMATHAANTPEYAAAKAKYEKAYEQYQKAKTIARQNTMLGAAITDLEERAKAWSVGTIDTTKMDRKASFLAETRDLYDNQLKNTVANEDDVKAANRAAARASNQSIEQFMYEKWRADPANAGKNLTYDAFVAQELNKMDKAKYQEEQNKYIKELEDVAKNVTKRAVGRKMAEAASGIENDTSRAVNKYLNDHRAEFDAFQNEAIGTEFDSVLNSEVQVSIGDFMKGNFGVTGIRDGVSNFAKIASDEMRNNSNYTIDYEDLDGNATNIRLRIDKTNTGEVTYVLQQKVSDNTVPGGFRFDDIQTFENDDQVQETISRYVREKGYKKAKFNLTDVRTYASKDDYTYTDTLDRYVSEIVEGETISSTIVDPATNNTTGSIRMSKIGNEVIIDYLDAAGNVDPARKSIIKVDKNGKPVKDSYTIAGASGQSETDFEAHMKQIFEDFHIQKTVTTRDKAPSNMRMSKMKDLAEREHDKFTFSQEYLDAQRIKREQEAAKKNENK